ncbi:exopolygalacturonase-like [Panicum miliaceum]|uniref:Exopolygalacturonase-like n=1 Tax=Panicum miliaceum TaxID=4540 RepID=A0A3L6S7E8_PANMI|nr:exopolygalacturonase-like [Panicum miliaceum]
MVLEDMVMEDVWNPIIIDQRYCPYHSCEHKNVSGVRLQDIRFENIKSASFAPARS